MLKKIVTVLIIFSMFVSVSPAVAAENSPTRPTIEQIFNEYHQAAFESQIFNETASASTYSLRSVQTLEQDTINALKEAGYEAYNVTSSNYHALESQLKSNFSDMGLDPNGSYIVTISGDDSNNDDTTSGISTRAVVPAPDLGGDYFNYTYEGTTYRMRYVTVTATQESALSRISHIELLDEYDADDLINDLNFPITILSSLNLLTCTDTLYSLISAILPDADNVVYSNSLMYTGGTNWTIRYTQIYDEQDDVWTLCGGVEYVTMRYYITYSYYSSVSNQIEYESTEGSYPTLYSSLYSDAEGMKERAAYAYERNARWIDDIPYVEYQFDGRTVITHSRRHEYLGYEPQ